MAIPVASRLLRLLPCLLLAGVALAGCGEPGGRELPPEWRGRDLTQPGWREWTVRPGWGLGVEYVWSSGTEVEWDWLVNGSGVLHFKIVRVQDGQAQTLMAMFGNESASALTAPQAGVYQFLWRNEFGVRDVPVWYHIPEGGLPRSYPPSEGPDCTFRTVAAAC